MKFIEGTVRGQYHMGCLDDMIDENNAVRFIDAYVDQLDMEYLGFQRKESQITGRPAYAPQDMLKLYIYGYFNRVRSSRCLEKECYRNIEAIWLLKGLRPDHKTIARFRQSNAKAMKNVFRDFVRLCVKLELYGKELIAVDGSKFKAWNSKDRNFTQGKIDNRLLRIDEKIAHYLNELDQLDQMTDESGEYTTNEEKKETLQKALKALRERKDTLKEYKASVSCGEETQVSLTDPDSRLMKTKDGLAVCLNVQTAVDSKNKLIAEFEVTNQVQDKNMMAPMARKAAEILKADHMTIAADNGYDSISDVAQVLADHHTPVVAGEDYEFWYPTTEEEAECVDDYDQEIARSVFLPERNIFICPMGHFLSPTNYIKAKHIAKYGNTTACANCTKKCTIQRYYYAERRIKFSEFSKECNTSPVPLKKIRVLQNKDIAAQRKCIVEHPFGTIKRGLNVNYLLLRTIPKAEGELALAFLVFNLKRAINIVGIQTLLAAIV